MEKFQLIPFLEIDEIGAASGLVNQNDSLFIISDNSTFLYRYNLNEKNIEKIKLFDDRPEIAIKKDKPDFETITLFENKLYLFGSGSTKKRNTGVTFNLLNNEIKEKDLSKIYKRLTESISIADVDLNIEGVIITDKTTYFFQRGNGTNAQNGVFCYDRINKSVEFKLIKLPEINEIQATFTDAILIDDSIYFLAAAENTNSTYDDGEILGSMIGTIDLKTLRLESCVQISDNCKFEGLTLYKKTATQIELLLCEDNDSEILKTTIYLLRIQLNPDF